MTNDISSPRLGFDALLAEADTENRARKFERETAHLPGSMDEAIPFYCDLIEQNHTYAFARRRGPSGRENGAHHRP